jgi:signal transduction histidine kinase
VSRPQNQPLRRALIALGAAGVVMGIVMAIVVASSDHETNPGLLAALGLLVAWSFLGTGLYAWDRRPDNLTGALMVAYAFAWLLSALDASNVPELYAIGLALQALPFGVLIHLLFAFPSGRLRRRFDRIVVACTYFATAVYPWAIVAFADPVDTEECPECPSNPLLVSDNETVFDILSGVHSAGGLAVCCALIGHIIQRRHEWDDPAERARYAPMSWAGAATVFLLGALLVSEFGPEEGNYDDYLFYAALLVLATLPYAFWVGLLRSKLSEAEVVAQENVRLDAELQARLEELRESRARIVEAGYAERRRLERDLHDGAQQRLVALALDLKRVRARLERDPGAAGELLEGAADELAAATEELRELARGIHPPVLTDRGLVPALEALASRAPLPVSVQSRTIERAPPAVEAAAYFVVSEALTNVARHAHARRAEVHVVSANGSLEVEVRDDGVGGADTSSGSGLRGLTDRVSALGGSLQVQSAGTAGTTVRAVIPTLDRGPAR